MYISGVDVSINTEKDINISNNTLNSGYGGAFYFTGDVNLLKVGEGNQKLIIKNNSATQGGAVFFTNSNTTLRINANFSNNYAAGNGGAIYFDKSSIDFQGNMIIQYNTARNYHGGGIFFNNCTVNFNNNCDVYLSNNYAYYGGGIQYVGSTINFNGGRVETSYHSLQYYIGNYPCGGGMHFSGSTANFNGGNVYIIGNYAPRVGGGIASASSRLNFYKGIVSIKNNGAGHRGGGIDFYISYQGYIYNNFQFTDSGGNNGGYNWYGCSGVNAGN